MFQTFRIPPADQPPSGNCIMHVCRLLRDCLLILAINNVKLRVQGFQTRIDKILEVPSVPQSIDPLLARTEVFELPRKLTNDICKDGNIMLFNYGTVWRARTLL